MTFSKNVPNRFLRIYGHVRTPETAIKGSGCISLLVFHFSGLLETAPSRETAFPKENPLARSLQTVVVQTVVLQTVVQGMKVAGTDF